MAMADVFLIWLSFPNTVYVKPSPSQARPAAGSPGAIHSTKNFRKFRKSFEKIGPPFEVDHFLRSDRSEFCLNGSLPCLWVFLKRFISHAPQTDHDRDKGTKNENPNATPMFLN